MESSDLLSDEENPMALESLPAVEGTNQSADLASGLMNINTFCKPLLGSPSSIEEQEQTPAFKVPEIKKSSISTSESATLPGTPMGGTLRGGEIYDSADFHEPMMEESEDQDASVRPSSPPPESAVLGPLHDESKPNHPPRRVREAICQDTQDWTVFEDTTEDGTDLPASTLIRGLGLVSQDIGPKQKLRAIPLAMAPTLDPETVKPPTKSAESSQNSKKKKSLSPEKEPITPPVAQKKEKERKEKASSRELENPPKGKSLLKRLEAASSDLADLCSSPLSSINQNTLSAIPKKKENKTKFKLPSLEDDPADSFENLKSTKDQKGGEWKKTNKSKLVDEKIQTNEIVPIKSKEPSPKKSSKKDLSKNVAAPVETYEKEAAGTKVSKKRKRESDADVKQSPKKKKKVTKKPKKIELSSEPDDESMETSSESEMEEEPAPVKKKAAKKKAVPKATPKSPVAVFKGIFFLVTGWPLSEQIDPRGELIDRETLESRIKSLGGRVVPDFSAAGKKTLKKVEGVNVPSCVLIAPQPTRTAKYLMAVAAKVPCIHFDWVIECYNNMSMADPAEHMLPSLGTEKQPKKGLIKSFPPDIEKLVFYSPKKDDSLRIEVVGVPAFKRQWEQIIHEAGGKVVSRLFLNGKVDYVISDDEPNDLVKERIKQVKLPLCSTEWVIQCLFSGKVVQPSESKKYRVSVDS